MKSKPSLSLVDPAKPRGKQPSPLRQLGRTGRDLWSRVHREFKLSDAGSLETLQQACEALDRAQALREQIDNDGSMIPTRGGMRAHPCLKGELACRAFIVRTLGRLGLHQDSTRPVGRPPINRHWLGGNYYDQMARDDADEN
jgi:hypothetical protein